MYLVRRIFNTKPGEARRVASMIHKQAQMYRDAGHRSEFKVYFNGGTLPGETNVVVLEWTEGSDYVPDAGRQQHPTRGADGGPGCPGVR